MRTLAIAFALFALASALHFPARSMVRVKRQQCGCVRLQTGGGMQCACQRPLGTSEVTSQDGLAGQVSAMSGNPQAQCSCVQILVEAPRYNCQCNPGMSTTRITVITTPYLLTTAATQPSTLAPITTSTTTTTTTTTTPVPTTTTALPTPPPSTINPLQPGRDQPSTNAAGCQCVMIRISSASTAQYSCNCPSGQQTYQQTPVQQVSQQLPLLDAPITTLATVTLPPTTVAPTTATPLITLPPITTAAPTLPPVLMDQPATVNPYPATAIANGTSAGCFCLDSGAPNMGCGCACDCITLTVTVPSGVCVCPQNDAGVVVPTTTPRTSFTPPPPTFPPQTAIPQTLPPVTTAAPTTLPPTTFAPITMPPTLVTSSTPAFSDASTALPMTTTCVLYPIQISAGTCQCMPQYEQCAQNICCLSSRFRSLKGAAAPAAADPAQESTFDIFVDMLNKIKTKINAN